MKSNEDDRHFSRYPLPIAEWLCRVIVIMVDPGLWLEADMHAPVGQPISQFHVFEVDFGKSLVKQTRLGQQELSIEGNVGSVEVAKIYVLTWLKSIKTKLLVTYFGDVVHQVVEFQFGMPLYVAEYCGVWTELPGQLDMTINQLRIGEDIVPQHENSFTLRAPDGGISGPGGAAMLVFKNDNRQPLRLLL